MHSIAVRVPRRHEDKFWDLDGYASSGKWSLERRPPHVGEGDYLYFAIGTELVARAPIVRLEGGLSTDGAPVADEPQARVHWDVSKMERLDPPVTFWLSKGFRYVPSSVEKKVQTAPFSKKQGQDNGTA